jgi:hypothetical protein
VISSLSGLAEKALPHLFELAAFRKPDRRQRRNNILAATSGAGLRAMWTARALPAVAGCRVSRLALSRRQGRLFVRCEICSLMVNGHPRQVSCCTTVALPIVLIGKSSGNYSRVPNRHDVYRRCRARPASRQTRQRHLHRFPPLTHCSHDQGIVRPDSSTKRKLYDDNAAGMRSFLREALRKLRAFLPVSVMSTTRRANPIGALTAWVTSS